MPVARILIVEDDPIIAADIGDRILALGYEVMASTRHGETAVAIVRGGSCPDLVLLDIQLADKLDGIATAVQLHDLCPGLPVIFLTANTDKSTFRKAREARPEAFLSKPFRDRDLTFAIELALQRNGSDQSNGSASPDSAVPASAPTSPKLESEALPDSPSSDFLRRDGAMEGPEIQDGRLYLNIQNRLMRIELSSILFVRAENYYCSLVTTKGEQLVTMTLKKFVSLLPADNSLWRCHRSYLINLKRVAEVTATSVILGQYEVPASRTKRRELVKLLKDY